MYVRGKYIELAEPLYERPCTETRRDPNILPTYCPHGIDLPYHLSSRLVFARPQYMGSAHSSASYAHPWCSQPDHPPLSYQHGQEMMGSKAYEHGLITPEAYEPHEFPSSYPASIHLLAERCKEKRASVLLMDDTKRVAQSYHHMATYELRQS